MLSDLEKRLLEIDLTHTPRFTNHCNHKKEEYIGTASYSYIRGKECGREWIDVYVYEDCTMGQEICIRFGEEPENYYSVGRVVDFLRRSHNENQPYAKALDILFYHGTFKYVRENK